MTTWSPTSGHKVTQVLCDKKQAPQRRGCRELIATNNDFILHGPKLAHVDKKRCIFLFCLPVYMYVDVYNLFVMKLDFFINLHFLKIFH